MARDCDARWDDIETDATTWGGHDCTADDPKQPLEGHEGGWIPVHFGLRVVGRYPDGQVTQLKEATVWIRECKWEDVSRNNISPGRSVITSENKDTFEPEDRDLVRGASGLTEIEIRLRTSGYPSCVGGRVVKSVATYPQWMLVSAPGCEGVYRAIDASWQGARIVELQCAAASPNSALNAPHSVVTALANDGKRRAVGRAR